MRKNLAALLAIALVLTLFGCQANPPAPTTPCVPTEPSASTSPTQSVQPTQPTTPTPVPTEPAVQEHRVTIAEAIRIANEAGETETADLYIITGTVKNVSKPQYGEMTITDGTDEIYVYGTLASDGKGYADMEEKPVAGDEITIAGHVKTFKGSPEFGKSTILSFTHKAPVASPDYEKVTVSQAREKAVGAKVSVSGVVAKITYANGMTPNGFFLIDASGSIYVYDVNAAGQVSEGNTVTLEGTRENYINADESSSAAKFGYTGCIQLTGAAVLTNDHGKTAFSTDGIPTATMKQIMDTPMSSNITTVTYKVNALIKKAPGDGFVNYYIDDLDGKTGSYVYTACNGSDFAYLDAFDGKICEVYVTAINCKSTASGCVYRLIPILVTDKGYSFNPDGACDFAYEYGEVLKGSHSFEADPALELPTVMNFDTIKLSGIQISYASDNAAVCYFENKDGITVLHTAGNGTANITVTISYGGKTLVKSATVTSTAAQQHTAMTVQQAIAARKDETVTVKGIVASGLANQTGFYLIDDTGAIAIRTTSDVMQTLKLGDEVVVSGRREQWSNCNVSVGQSVIADAVVDTNLHGNHSYSKASFITDKTLADLASLPVSEDHTAQVYRVTVTIQKKGTAYSTNYTLVSGDTSIMLYSGSGAQYAFLDEFVGKEVTVEMALCNWNDKNPYKACVLSAECDGTVVINQNGFAH